MQMERWVIHAHTETLHVLFYRNTVNDTDEVKTCYVNMTILSKHHSGDQKSGFQVFPLIIHSSSTTDTKTQMYLNVFKKTNGGTRNLSTKVRSSKPSLLSGGNYGNVIHC